MAIYLAASAIAAFAKSVILFQSPLRIASSGANQEPPTHWTLDKLKYSVKFAGPMPPVGQNVISGNGPPIDFSALTPPEASAGKNSEKAVMYS